jgi:MFS family permease
MPQDKTAQSPRYPWLLLVMLCGAYFLHQADRALFGVVLPLIKTDLQLSDAQLGAIATVLFAVITVLVPLAGPLADHVSRKALVVGSLLFWSLSTMLTGMATGLLSLTILRGVATGGGEALYTPAAYSLIGSHHAGHKGMALSIHQMALYAGLIASGAAGGYVAQAYGWRAAFYVFGGAGVLWGLYMAVKLKPDPRYGHAGPALAATFLSVGRFFMSPIPLLLSTAFGSYMLMTNAYIVWAPELFREKFGLGVAAAGAISMLVHHGAAVVGVLFGGWVSDRFARRAPASRILLQCIALGAAIPFILLMARADALVLSCAAVAAFGLFRGIYDSNIQASLFEFVPEKERGTAWSLMVLVGFLIGSSSPWITGLLKQQMNSSGALASIFAGYCAVYGVGCLLLLAAWQLARRRLPAPQLS